MNKYSLYSTDTSLLQEYTELQRLNPKTWNISEYLNLKYDINAALAFSKLYFPDFFEKDGCIILGIRYDEKIFDAWKRKLNGDISLIEKYCNFCEVSDYFQLNKVEYSSDEMYNKAIEEFSKVLKISWQVNCQLLFPERNIIVEVSEDYGTKRITLFSATPTSHL